MSVKTTVIDNGMTIVTHAMPHLESVSLGCWVKAGSRSETINEHGISHLLEHMAFKGTKNRTARQIVETIENVGGDINAATSIENTGYFISVLKEDVALGTELLADILQHSVFNDKDLTREKEVIVQEISASHDSPDDYVFDLFQSAAFGDQPLGRNILGTADTVRSFDPDAIRGFMSRNYVGPSMVFAAAGKVDHDMLVREVTEKFAVTKHSQMPDPEPGAYIGGDRRLVRDIEQMHFLLGFKGRAYHSDGFYASQILASILGGGMSSRLFQEVREQRGLCYSIHSFHWAFADTGVFAVSSSTSADGAKEALPVIIELLKKSCEDIEEKEVLRVRNQIRAGLLMSLESPRGRAGQLARQQLLWGRVIPMEETLDRINAITAERVREVAAQIFLGDDEPSFASIGPNDSLMSLAEVKGLLAK